MASSVGTRFIPARAGNTQSHLLLEDSVAVHPRAGGEHVNRRTASGWNFGSSPRGRGTLRIQRPSTLYRRFIPARAGNTISDGKEARDMAVHPRAGGEHIITQRIEPLAIGSSPRGRGTPIKSIEENIAVRFIPARAGNTQVPSIETKILTVHPRAGGEHIIDSMASAAAVGSSPRGRGTQPDRMAILHIERFIPARAGNTEDGRLW